MIQLSDCISHLEKLQMIAQRLIRSKDPLFAAKELQSVIDDFRKVLRTLDEESSDSLNTSLDRRYSVASIDSHRNRSSVSYLCCKSNNTDNSPDRQCYLSSDPKEKMTFISKFLAQEAIEECGNKSLVVICEIPRK